MVANRLIRFAASVLVVAFVACPAHAGPTLPASASPGGPIAVSIARISAISALSNQKRAPHRSKRSCGKKVLTGLAIGAAVGAAYGSMLTANGGEAGFGPGLALLGGAIGADVGYYACR